MLTGLFMLFLAEREGGGDPCGDRMASSSCYDTENFPEQKLKRFKEIVAVKIPVMSFEFFDFGLNQEGRILDGYTGYVVVPAEAAKKKKPKSM